MCKMEYTMHRAQLLIAEWQYDALRSLAERRGVSISALVRRILSDTLQPPPDHAASRLEELAGIGDDPDATGRDHDRFLYGPAVEG